MRGSCGKPGEESGRPHSAGQHGASGEAATEVTNVVSDEAAARGTAFNAVLSDDFTDRISIATSL